ncbi:Maf family protein [Gordoniibacillus kamchatkensis]|uniref:Maf family protein n=1 Tax=Gordoniibacillus kamchatkensis TaxID=1590651 RepID=UPI0006961857|nr:Maf family protein [Paenibacillus sp. VKM B-2647]
MTPNENLAATPAPSPSQTSDKLVLLASSSPRRQELIRSLGIRYDIRPSNADETTEPGLAPEQIVETLSRRKASAVYESLGSDDRRGDAVIVGSDTIVVLDGNVLGKPRDEGDALRMLSALQGRPHTVYTGVACLDAATGRCSVAHKATTVYMKPLGDSRIRRYIATGEPMDKAGDYDNKMYLY